MKIKVLVILFLIANGIHSQSSYTPSKTNQNVIRHIHHSMEDRNIPGLAVAVMKGSELVLSQGFGYANLEYQVPVTTQSIFQIASVTKIFTAMAALVLYEQGHIQLDDPVGNYLPSLPGKWHAITVRQLLNHTSGIKSFSSYDSIPCRVGKDVREYLKGDVLQEVGCLPLEFEPGEYWKYGDTGYYIAGLLIEKVSGKNYEEYLEETVFNTLGMTSTRLFNYRDIITNRVDGYTVENGNFYNVKTFELDEFANGGIISNADDMIKMHEAFVDGKLLKRETLALMFSPTRLKNGTLINYGLGIGLTPYKNQIRYGHNGGGGLGFATSFAHFPENDLTIILLTNADQPQGYIGELANEIAGFYF